MPHKLLKYLGVTLLIISTSQCLSKCSKNLPYNTVDIDLKWEQEPQTIALNNLDIEDVFGLTCHVPSENATYFLNAKDGNVWEFTPEGENGLTTKSITNVGNFSPDNSFVFAAGSTEEQALFFGNISETTIDIYKLESETWNQVIATQDLDTWFPDANVDTSKFIAACTVEIDGEKKGCIIVSLVSTNNDTQQLGCLLFTPSTSGLKSINIKSAYNTSIAPFSHFTGMVEVEKGKIFLGKGYENGTIDRYDLLSINDDNTLTVLSLDNPNLFTVHNRPTDDKRPTWNIFPLLLEGEFPIYKPIFTIFNDTDKERIICKLDGQSQYDFQKMALIPDPENEILGKPNLIIPFHNALYLLTTITAEDDTVEAVTYKAKLVIASNKP
ncbi:hypothetical protein Aasi_0379 [Candidatus Amoebophilus asiaticus 5a2]|uniref:Uncharacterized protein n=1 Tax=Amoebophilus asiaticus (strain 5a2) TaxID=452471 RepID=B3ERE9_AMOA5|nr:hypothetical protein [Candidatus Amoebophilus asiaticus]ACE05801.1 hypothetical protein Aasi_0379 [Candidatus Amoebophilus asiaticus 5a2]